MAVSLALDPASRKLLEFGLIGLVVAGALIAAFEFKPANVLPVSGTLVVEITDAPPALSGQGFACSDCAVMSLNVTVNSIKVHRAGALSLTGEWIEVLSSPRTLDLLKVKNSPQILGSVSVPGGMITSVRMNVTSATAALAERGVTVTLTVPSGELEFNLQSFATVKGGLTTSIVIDFQPHVVCQGNGQCRLTPVLLVKEIRGPQ